MLLDYLYGGEIKRLCHVSIFDRDTNDLHRLLRNDTNPIYRRKCFVGCRTLLKYAVCSSYSVRDNKLNSLAIAPRFNCAMASRLGTRH